MSILIHLTYHGKPGMAKAFAEEMTQLGLVDAARAIPGCERYEYYLPFHDDTSLLLIDQWTDQSALDAHHASPTMFAVMALREKYGLTVSIQRYQVIPDEVPKADQSFLTK